MRDPGVIVLAGDRGPDDPLASGAGVPGKVLVEIAGKPMLTRVIETVDAFVADGEVVVVCRDRPEYVSAVERVRKCRRIAPAADPAASVVAALETLPRAGPVLVVTGDHPLIRPEWLQALVERAEAAGADAVVGVVDHADVMARFPGSRRTRYRFSDRDVCGTNLFYFSGRRGQGQEMAELWRAFEADRKRPWKIVRRLGTWNLLRYLVGRLSLDEAMEVLSKRTDMRVAAVLLDAPEAAVDVDTPADLALVTAIIEGDARVRSAS